MPPTSTCDHTATPPDGVLPCGCTTDVVERLMQQAGLKMRPERKLWNTIEAHVAPHLGPLEGVLHDAAEGRVWADVLVHRPAENRPSVDLVTAGMSARRMRPPSPLRRRGAPPRAELMLRFPPEWASGHTVTETLLSRNGRWALEWLLMIARVPHELRGFLGDAKGLSLRCRAIPLFKMPGCPFEAAIVASPGRFGRPLPTLYAGRRTYLDGAGGVRFLSLVPLFEREFEFALERGAERLFKALADAGVDDLVRCERDPVV